GDLIGIAGGNAYLLLEMPHDLVVELADTVRNLRRAGVRPILAHPERHEELLHEPGRLEPLIEAGCLVQVCSGSLTQPASSRAGKALKDWFRRGMVHLLGSDGHSLHRRPPTMRDAYRCICRLVGSAMADRIASTNGLSVLQGRPLRVVPPQPQGRRWFSRLW